MQGQYCPLIWARSVVKIVEYVSIEQDALVGFGSHGFYRSMCIGTESHHFSALVFAQQALYWVALQFFIGVPACLAQVVLHLHCVVYAASIVHAVFVCFIVPAWGCDKQAHTGQFEVGFFMYGHQPDNLLGQGQIQPVMSKAINWAYTLKFVAAQLYDLLLPRVTASHVIGAGVFDNLVHADIYKLQVPGHFYYK